MSQAVQLDRESALRLPVSITSRSDVAKLILEIEAVDYELSQQAIRDPEATLAIPSLSNRLEAICRDNKVDIVNRASRDELTQKVREVKDQAPIMHLTFATEVDQDIIGQLVTWIRIYLHPSALVTTGVQPRIVGGCVIRTPDHIYDFSLRERFQSNKDKFIEKLKQAIK